MHDAEPIPALREAQTPELRFNGRAHTTCPGSTCHRQPAGLAASGRETVAAFLVALLCLGSGCGHLAPASVSIVAAAPPRALAAERTSHQLEFDTTRDLLLTGAALASVGVFYLLDDKLGPKACRWCGRDEEGVERLNSVDRYFRRTWIWCHPDEAENWSDRTLMASLVGSPALTAASAVADDAGENWDEDTLIALQSASFAIATNTAVKLLAARERPYLLVPIVRRPDCIPSPQPGASIKSADQHLSFYSGHTTLAFSTSVAAGMVASMRGYRLAPLVWGVGLATAATTGYLRVAADRHYFSDVAVGAVTGIAAGVLVPALLHPRIDNGGAEKSSGAMGLGIRLVW